MKRALAILIPLALIALAPAQTQRQLRTKSVVFFTKKVEPVTWTITATRVETLKGSDRSEGGVITLEASAPTSVVFGNNQVVRPTEAVSASFTEEELSTIQEMIDWIAELELKAGETAEVSLGEQISVLKSGKSLTVKAIVPRVWREFEVKDAPATEILKKLKEAGENIPSF